MSSQDFGRENATARTERTRTAGKTKSVKDAAGEALAKASDVALDAGTKARQAAAETASTMTEQVKELLDRQIGSGASAAAQLARSMKLAANDLGTQSPVLAGLAQSFADKVETYADDLKDQTVEQLARTVSDFTRRQPALVFGLAAVAGFLLLRTLKSSSDLNAPSIQPSQPNDQDRSHG